MRALRTLLHSAMAWPVFIAGAYATQKLRGFQIFFSILEPGAYSTVSIAFAIALNNQPLCFIPLTAVVLLAIYPADTERLVTYLAPLAIGAGLGYLGRQLVIATKQPTRPRAMPRRPAAPYKPPVANDQQIHEVRRQQ